MKSILFYKNRDTGIEKIDISDYLLNEVMQMRRNVNYALNSVNNGKVFHGKICDHYIKYYDNDEITPSPYNDIIYVKLNEI